MNNKRLLNHVPNKTAVYGFSIPRFLVANLLSIIALMAVSSTYLIVRGLDKSANTRIDIQQDLRNTVSMAARSTHMAGNFGCLDMSNFPVSVITEDKSSDEYILKTAGMNNLLPTKKTNKLGYAGFARIGKALLFQYGIDKADPVVKTTIVSDCSGIAKPRTGIKDLDAAKTILKTTDSDQNDSIAIMKRKMIAYTVGKLGEESGLFCLQLSNDGPWSSPQLLTKGITAMDVHYIYEEYSRSENISANDVNTESSDYKAALGSPAETKSPVSIQIVLNSGSIDPSKGQDNKVDIYNINATIHGESICVD